jgi:hypothetical protein
MALTPAQPLTHRQLLLLLAGAVVLLVSARRPLWLRRGLHLTAPTWWQQQLLVKGPHRLLRPPGLTE